MKNICLQLKVIKGTLILDIKQLTVLTSLMHCETFKQVTFIEIVNYNIFVLM